MIASILVVDDESDIREMLSRHFRYLGYEVDTAANGVEALSKLSTKKVDILISDIMMPEMTGVELLRQVRAEYPLVRPIMITGYVTQENAMACMRYGADCCIFKPLTNLSTLEQAVTEGVNKIQYWVNILKELRGMK